MYKHYVASFSQGHSPHLNFVHRLELLVHFWLLSLSSLMGFHIWHKLIIMTRRWLMCKKHIAGLKAMVILCIWTLSKSYSETFWCLVHNFVLHNGISKSFGINNHFDKTICQIQELFCQLKGSQFTLKTLWMGYSENLFIFGLHIVLQCGVCKMICCVQGPILLAEKSRSQCALKLCEYNIMRNVCPRSKV